jgi:chemotaxis protein CheX
MRVPPEWGSGRLFGAADTRGNMRTEFINPFLQAATEVLEAELGTKPRRGSIGLEKSVHTSNDITAVVGVTGEIAGMVLFTMTEATGCAMVSKMMEQDFPEFDDLAQSGIAEIGNVITGRAAVLLAEAGFTSDLAPPMLIMGRGALINTLDMQRLVIPLETEFGAIEVQVALKMAEVVHRAAA